MKFYSQYINMLDATDTCTYTTKNRSVDPQFLKTKKDMSIQCGKFILSLKVLSVYNQNIGETETTVKTSSSTQEKRRGMIFRTMFPAI